MIKYLLPVFILFNPLLSMGQIVYEPDATIPVSVSGNELENAWAGGLNSVQYNNMDLNFDGVNDLVLFDRTSQKLTTFLAQNQRHIHAPEYESFFPDAIVNWLVLADFNCDGLEDIFTSTPLGISVYENVSTDTTLAFELEVRGLRFAPNNINLQVNGLDVPAITDVDGDSDLDIAVYDFAGSGRILYYLNESIETTGDCGLNFILDDLRWGDFTECDCNDFVFGDEECSLPDGNGSIAVPAPDKLLVSTARSLPTTRVADPFRIKHLGANTILLIDLDGDGDRDLITGDEGCFELYFLENVGTADSAVFRNLDNSFPNGTQAAIFPIFPSAYSVDVDFDGVNDLLVSPNEPDNETLLADFSNSSWFYSNNGTNDDPNFTFQQNDFLQEQMIDVGEFAYPTFVDVDNDLDLDLVIGNFGGFINGLYSGTLTLFRNVGDAFLPRFEFETNNFLNLAQFGLRNIRPFFVDLNGDGNLDLMMTGSSRTSFFTRFFFAFNQSNTGISIIPSDLINNQIIFNLGANDNPLFFDVDQDGNTDLLLGRPSGVINYFRNTGNNQNFNFELEEDDFLNLSTGRRNVNPVATDYDGDGNLDLITTDMGENMWVNFNLRESIELGTVENMDRLMIRNPIINVDTATANFGQASFPAFADLRRTGFQVLAVGNIQGGINLFSNVLDTPTPFEGEGFRVRAFPSPLDSPATEITIQTSEAAIVNVFAYNGQRVFDGLNLSSGRALLNVSNLVTGVYIIEAISNRTGETANFRFLVRQ